MRTLKTGDSILLGNGAEVKIGKVGGRRVSVSVIAPLEVSINIATLKVPR